MSAAISDLRFITKDLFDSSHIVILCKKKSYNNVVQTNKAGIEMWTVTAINSAGDAFSVSIPSEYDLNLFPGQSVSFSDLSVGFWKGDNGHGFFYHAKGVEAS